MKVLHIFDHSIPLHSGYTFRSQAILENQRASGWETAHVTSIKHGDGSACQETVDGLRFYRTARAEMWTRKLPILNQLQVISTLAKRLDEVIALEKPDILHAHSPALNGIAAVRAGRRHGLPVVYECRAFWEDAAVDHGTSRDRGVRYRLTRSLETRVFERADAVTTICEGLRNDIIGRGIGPDKVTIVPNAVDIAQFRVGAEPDPELLKRLRLAGKRVLGFIGSFYAYEGVTLLLRALPEILEKEPNTRLLLVGGGPQEREIKELLQSRNLREYVVVTGRIPHEHIQRYYDLVDVFVYPRLHMRLTDLVTPLKPLEAMAQGKVVVASDVGGHRELIEDGYNGRLFVANKRSALVRTLIELLEKPESWSELKVNGRRYVERERTWPKSVMNYHAVYRSLL